MSVRIRSLRPADVDALAAAFADWPKPRRTFASYAERVDGGELVVAEVDGAPVGYLIISWRSPYPPFLATGVPEIGDFNVLPAARRRGVGTALMDEAERRVADRSDVVGLGVGLYADYGSAQRMYVRRGYLPDGAGVVRDGRPIPPGTTVRLDDDPVIMFTRQLR